MEEPVDPNADSIESGLLVPGEKRHSAYLGPIVDFIKKSSLGDFLDGIYPEQLHSIARSAKLFKADGREFLFRMGSSINSCLVLFSGAISIEDSNGERWVKPGAVFGVREIMADITQWPFSAKTVSPKGAKFLSLSIRTMTSLFGTRTPSVEDSVRFFLRFHDLWGACHDDDGGAVAHPAFYFLTHGVHMASAVAEQTPEEAMGEQLQLKKLKEWATGAREMEMHEVQAVSRGGPLRRMRVVPSARLLHFHRTAHIVKQGDPRRYLYVIHTGEVAVTRMVEMDARGRLVEGTSQHDSRLAPAGTEVCVGLKLYPGDFFFMDGADVAWLRRSQVELDGKEAWEPDDDGIPPLAELARRRRAILSTAPRKVRRHLFERHRFGLLATTHVKVLAMPLEEVAMHQMAFRKLLAAAVDRYPVLSVSDDMIARRLTSGSSVSSVCAPSTT